MCTCSCKRSSHVQLVVRMGGVHCVIVNGGLLMGLGRLTGQKSEEIQITDDKLIYRSLLIINPGQNSFIYYNI